MFLILTMEVLQYFEWIGKKKKRGTKDTKGTAKLINLKQTDNTMAKNGKDKQTTAHTTQHRKLKNKQHEPHQKTRGDLRCSGRVSGH